MVRWVEPGPGDTTLYKSCTEAHAIGVSKAAALEHGYVHANDEAALEDFLCVHWAWIDNGADFNRFWCEVKVFVLLDCLMLIKDSKCHPCFFRQDTLFDIRRTTILMAAWEIV